MNMRFTGLLAVTMFAVTSLAGTHTAYASDEGGDLLFYPGTSPRTQTSQDSDQAYTWGGVEFDTFEELVIYVRNYIIQKPTGQTGAVLGAHTSSSAYANVTTLQAADLMAKSAMLRGKLALNEGADHGNVWFEYGMSFTNLTEKTDTIRLGMEDSNIFRDYIVNLAENTQYYYRAVVEDKDGNKDYGMVMSFHTSSE